MAKKRFRATECKRPHRNGGKLQKQRLCKSESTFEARFTLFCLFFHRLKFACSRSRQPPEVCQSFFHGQPGMKTTQIPLQLNA